MVSRTNLKTAYLKHYAGNENNLDFDLEPYLPLEYYDLSDLDLTYIDFEDLELNNINFSNSKLKGVSFNNTLVTDCVFDMADLTYSTFAGAIVKDNTFIGTLLDRIDLIKAKEVVDNTFSDNDVEIVEINLTRGKVVSTGKAIWKEKKVDQGDLIEQLF